MERSGYGTFFCRWSCSIQGNFLDGRVARARASGAIKLRFDSESDQIKDSKTCVDFCLNIVKHLMDSVENNPVNLLIFPFFER